MSFDRRSARFLALARRYARRRIARDLDGLFARGVERTAGLARRRPLILAANHVGWWDTFVLVALDQALGTTSWALMDAENVRRLPFFGWIGAVPLERGSGAAARRGLRDSAALLGHPGRALWIFPQGEQRPAHLRPLGFLPGVRLLSTLVPDAAVVPVSLQYAFRERPGPAAFAHLGEPLPAADLDLAALEASVVAGLDEIDALLAGDADPWPALVPPGDSAPESGLGARILARLRRSADDDG